MPNGPKRSASGAADGMCNGFNGILQGLLHPMAEPGF